MSRISEINDKKPKSNSQTKQHLIVQYIEQSDGVYQGYLDRAYKKESVGVFVSDDSLTYIGEWYQDQFHGEGLIIFPFGGYLFADFKKNHINGPGVLRMPQSKLIVGHFSNSMLHGICFTLNILQKTWTMSEYTNGILARMIQEERGGDYLTVPKIMLNYVELYMKFQRVLLNDFKAKNQSLIDIDFPPNGYLQMGLIKDGLQVVFHPNPIQFNLQIGFFKNKLLDGYGRQIKENGDIYDGVWKNNQLDMGYIYYKQKNQYIQVKSNERLGGEPQMVKEGFNFPQHGILQMRSDMHYRSKFFLDKQTAMKSLNYLSQFRLLSLEDYQNATMDTFIKKNSRASQVYRQSIIMQTIEEAKPSSRSSEIVESSLSLIKKNNYLQEIVAIEQSKKDPSQTNSKRSIQQEPQSPIKGSSSHMKESIQLSSVKGEGKIIQDASLKSLEISQIRKSTLENANNQPAIGISTNGLGGNTSGQNSQRLSTLRNTFRQQEAPPQLRSKIFEKFNIYDFENIRKNTHFESKEIPVQEIKKPRPKKKIFSVEKSDSRGKFLVNVREYQQFLEVSGLSEQENNFMLFNQ